MTGDTTQSAPSRRFVLGSLAAAFVLASVITLTIVLPAEFHRDPTGFGRFSGLLDLSAPARPAAAPGLAEAAVSYVEGFRSDVIDIPLRFGEELEYKVAMKAGETLVYSWVLIGPNPAADKVYFDFHGESPPTPKVRVDSYLKQDGARASHGALVAPFDGIHGWYLLNDSETPIVVRLRLSGYYRLIPGAPARQTPPG